MKLVYKLALEHTYKGIIMGKSGTTKTPCNIEALSNVIEIIGNTHHILLSQFTVIQVLADLASGAEEAANQKLAGEDLSLLTSSLNEVRLGLKQLGTEIYLLSQVVSSHHRPSIAA